MKPMAHTPAFMPELIRLMCFFKPGKSRSERPTTVARGPNNTTRYSLTTRPSAPSRRTSERTSKRTRRSIATLPSTPSQKTSERTTQHLSFDMLAGRLVDIRLPSDDMTGKLAAGFRNTSRSVCPSPISW
jgi:hypothetical protein